MNDALNEYLLKARESLLGAQSELANLRFNNAANRAYYTAYQAAVTGLIHEGVNRVAWYHVDVEALFGWELFRRRKL
jgi:uncharacterized protein (UPF0332 family)